MLRSLTLIGSSSGRNAGDAAIMSSIMSAVDAACGEPLAYEIPTIRPRYIRENYPDRARPVGILPWNLSVKLLGLPTYRSIMRSDLTLIFDAILFDRALYNPLFNFLSTLSFLLPAAKRRGRKLAFYNVGTGPVETPMGRKMLRRVAELMDFITVRDQASCEILRDIGVRHPRIGIGADVALNAEGADSGRVSEIFRELGIDPAREEVLALNVNAYIGTWSGAGNRRLSRSEFVATYAAAVNRALERMDATVLMVVTQHLDVAITREVMSRLRADRKVRLFTNVGYNHYDVKGVLSRVSLLFAMRLHSMILASSSCTPVAGLAYQPKIHHYFDVLGLPEFSLDFSRFAEEELSRHLLRAWNERVLLRRHLVQGMPRLKAQAGKAAEMVAALHREEDLDAAFARLYGPGA